MRQNEFVVYGDKSVLHLFAAQTREFADNNEDRQEHFESKASELSRKRNIMAQTDHYREHSHAMRRATPVMPARMPITSGRWGEILLKP